MKSDFGGVFAISAESLSIFTYLVMLKKIQAEYYVKTWNSDSGKIRCNAWDAVHLDVSDVKENHLYYELQNNLLLFLFSAPNIYSNYNVQINPHLWHFTANSSPAISQNKIYLLQFCTVPLTFTQAI